jgi:hypothetical protein
VSEEAVRVAIHVADREIEVAVVVVIEPDAADAAARIREADRGRDVDESAGIVPEERVRAIAERDEEIERPAAATSYQPSAPRVDSSSWSTAAGTPNPTAGSSVTGTAMTCPRARPSGLCAGLR